MDEFYKNIKQSINKLPEEQPSKADWSSFQAYRENKTPATPQAFPWLLAATIALIFLLLGSNVYWASKSVSRITEQNTSIIHDTIYITQTIETPTQQLENTILALQAELGNNRLLLANYDTRHHHLQTQYAAQGHFLTSLQSQLITQEQQLSLLPEPANLNMNSTPSLTAGDNTDIAKATNDEETIHEALLYCPPLPTFDIAFLAVDDQAAAELGEINWMEAEKRFNLLAAITPKSLSLNLNTGTLAHLSGRAQNSQGVYFDINASTFIAKHLRARIGVYGFRGQNELDGGANYPGTPVISIPNDQEIKEIKINTTSIGYQLGLDYLIRTDSRWSPYLGLGYAQSITYQDKFSFEINSPQGEYYISPESAVDQAKISQLLLALGADCRLSPKLDATLGIGYSYDLSPVDNTSFRLSGGLYYHF